MRFMRLPSWLWRRKQPAPPPHDDVPAAMGTHLHVAAGNNDDDDNADDAGSVSSERSLITLPLNADEDYPAGAGDGPAVRAHCEVDGSGSDEEYDGDESCSGSDDGETAEDVAGGHRRRRRAPGHHHRRRGGGGGVPALVVVAPAAAVMLLALVALVAWKRRQRRLL